MEEPRKYRVYKVVGERPTETPSGEKIGPDDMIFNAPRPIFGRPDWQGDFLHGVFYAVIGDYERQFSPETADGWINQNIALDAWLLEYVTPDDVWAWAKAYYLEKHGIDVAANYDRNDPQDWRNILSAYYRHTTPKD